MNIGQLYETHLSMSLNDLKENMIKLLKKGAPQDEIKHYLSEYINIIDKSETKWYYNQFKEQLPNEITEEFIRSLTVIQPPFESCKFEDIKAALEYSGTKFKQKIYEPVARTYLKNEISVGYIYFFRMVHIAEEKLAARGIGTYAKRTLQPLGGRKNKGGQRCGEMETACIIGHDANNLTYSGFDPNMVDDNKEIDTKPESVKLLSSYLTVIGVDQN